MAEAAAPEANSGVRKHRHSGTPAFGYAGMWTKRGCSAMDFARTGIRPAVMASRDFASGLFDQLRRDGLDEPGVSRDTYGPGEQRAHATCAAAAVAMGLTIERDPAANLYLTLPGLDASEKQIVIGSHLDSVPHGGNFDGAAG